jgi:hypothetical protein
VSFFISNNNSCSFFSSATSTHHSIIVIICHIEYDDQTIYIADYRNDRIVEWKSNATNGKVVASENERRNQMNQLDHPTDVIIDKENNLIIADYGNR